MTSEERIAAIERVVKNQLNEIWLHNKIEKGKVLATKDEMFAKFNEYVHHTTFLTGDVSYQCINMAMRVADYWEFVKKLADTKKFFVSDDDLRVRDNYEGRE